MSWKTLLEKVAQVYKEKRRTHCQASPCWTCWAKSWEYARKQGWYMA